MLTDKLMLYHEKNDFFWSHHEACGVLAPWQGTEPGPSNESVKS